MTRKKAVSLLIAASVLILFIIILLAVFCFPLVFVFLLLLVMGAGMLKRRKPAFFAALRKPRGPLAPPVDRPTDPLKHGNQKKTYLMLVGLNTSNKHRITVDNSHYTIGRDDTCNFVLKDDELISRRHLIIEYNAEENLCYVRDTSTNGTLLNNVRLKRNVSSPLHHGDILQIAGTIFSVEYVHF